VACRYLRQGLTDLPADFATDAPVDLVETSVGTGRGAWDSLERQHEPGEFAA
jgi:hypothetical protein